MVRKYKRKRPRNPDRRMAAAAQLRDKGLSLRQIGEALACSYQTVANDLARWELQNQNVVPLSKTAVKKVPLGGENLTPEFDSEPSNIVSMDERRRQA